MTDLYTWQMLAPALRLAERLTSTEILKIDDETAALEVPEVKALVEAATEVGRISDRDHVAWHRLNAALAALKGGK